MDKLYNVILYGYKWEIFYWIQLPMCGSKSLWYANNQLTPIAPNLISSSCTDRPKRDSNKKPTYHLIEYHCCSVQFFDFSANSQFTSLMTKYQTNFLQFREWKKAKKGRQLTFCSSTQQFIYLGAIQLSKVFSIANILQRRKIAWAKEKYKTRTCHSSKRLIKHLQLWNVWAISSIWCIISFLHKHHSFSRHQSTFFPHSHHLLLV